MKKLESTFANMALSLVIIAVVAAAALAGVFTLTKDTIDDQKKQKEQKAIFSVLPNQGADEEKDLIVYRAFTDATMTNFVGSAVKISENGFGGKFKLMVGFDADGVIVDYSVLEHQETPGLGDKMGRWFKTDKNNQSIINRKAEGNFTVSKDGGDVDAITAATISSRGFLSAVNGAFEAFNLTKPAQEVPETVNDSVPALLPEEQLANDSINEQSVNAK